jgi:NarL family two-component system response regulator LiaR
MNPIRVMVVDDHDSVRRALGFSLRILDDLQFIGAAGNGREAIHLCDQLHPDVVLMDILMPEMDGVTATREIHQSHPDVRIIALTSDKDPNTFQAIQQAGAAGYLIKSASIDEIAKAIFAVCIK